MVAFSDKELKQAGDIQLRSRKIEKLLKKIVAHDRPFRQLVKEAKQYNISNDNELIKSYFPVNIEKYIEKKQFYEGKKIHVVIKDEDIDFFIKSFSFYSQSGYICTSHNSIELYFQDYDAKIFNNLYTILCDNINKIKEINFYCFVKKTNSFKVEGIIFNDHKFWQKNYQ